MLKAYDLAITASDFYTYSGVGPAPLAKLDVDLRIDFNPATGMVSDPVLVSADYLTGQPLAINRAIGADSAFAVGVGTYSFDGNGAAQLSDNFFDFLIVDDPDRSDFLETYFARYGNAGGQFVANHIETVASETNLPEPTTWILSILGFFMVGAAMRLPSTAADRMHTL